MAEPVLVAVPTCDRPAMAAEAVASALAQEGADLVVVVADDGRTPLSRAALPGDARVHVVRATTRSPGGARNAAVAHGEDAVLGGRARLVAFLDDDDLWLPRHLAASRAALEAAPAAAFVHGAATTRSAQGDAPYHARDEGPLEGDLFATLLRRDVVATSSLVVRGDAFAGVGRFREDLSHGEDLDLLLRLSARGPAAFVAASTVVHREHGGNVSHALAAKATAQADVLASWLPRRPFLAPAVARTLRRELARRRRREVRRLLAEGTVPRAQVRAVAAHAWREVRSLDTLRARLDAWLRPRAH